MGWWLVFVLLYGAFGSLLYSMGITFADWQAWTLLCILMAVDLTSFFHARRKRREV